ncbi:serine/threonine protein kinase [Paraliomyxa miuraensis]|uniref:serine/threonine protein kinase n=1 Tax=Paraliomyxa miuraensis TaxID=376150 RepID=UPI00224EED19|nr:serine/threonine-protein kinase [Paraliomyxa miuraensis]MCX4239513.1 serine/threonine protein kinase [Paraliomyxa miuraensis]
MATTEPTIPGATPHDLLPAGTRLANRYVVGELIGGGGMAQVYRGEHETIGRAMAIKVLASELAHEPSIVERFIQEARAASKIHHENVVEVTDFGETETGRPFMVMEYLEGEDLGHTLAREGRISWDRAQPILLQLLAALQAVHEQGVVHRDIKPENIFLLSRMGSHDFVKVCDFGIAKVLRGSRPGGKSLTVKGQLIGTPPYMSPEQCLGADVDARADLYTAGIIAYELLTGRTPFESEDPVKMIRMHVYEPVPPMADKALGIEVDPQVEAVIVRALAKDRDERFSSANELARALLRDTPQSSSTLLPGLRKHFEGTA